MLSNNYTGSMSGEQFWFEADKQDLPHYLSGTVKELVNRQSIKNELDKQNFRAYANQDLDGFDITAQNASTVHNGLVFNVIQSITDTIVSKIGKNKPKISFLTDEGDWELKQRAEDLETFIYGQFYKSGTYQNSPRALKRACVFGDGFTKIYVEGDQIKDEIVSPLELLVDDREARYGNPTTLYQMKYVSKHLLKNLYPKFESQIDQAGAHEFANTITSSSYYVPAGMIPVIEAWRLPTRKGSKDGRHCISISNQALLDEGWDKEYFPFSHIQFTEKLFGFWGAGVAELLCGIQAEINRTIKRIAQSIHIAAVPRVFLEYSAKIVKDHINNDLGTIINYRNNPPIFSTAQAVNAEVFNHLDRLYQKAHQIIGVSMLSVGSQKPAGLNSAPSLREYHDIETERYATLQNSYDEFHLSKAKMMIDCAKEIAQVDPNFAIMAKTQEGTKRIKWKDVYIDEDAYIMQMYPTNLLPQQPSARTDKVIELIDGGIFDKDEAVSLLDYPDVKAITKLKTAKIDDIMLTITRMMKHGEYNKPQPYQDLNAGKNYCQSFYLMYKNQNAPASRLDLLLRWIVDAEALQRSFEEEEMLRQAALQPQLTPPATQAQPKEQQINIPNNMEGTLGQMEALPGGV